MTARPSRRGVQRRAIRQLDALFAGPWRAGDLVRFHTEYKLVLMAHSPKAYAALGRLVAGVRSQPAADVASGYRSAFEAALATLPSRGTHANVLQHIAGYFTRDLDATSRARLQRTIERYRLGQLPLAAPLGRLRRYARRFRAAYLEEQAYLRPRSWPGERAGRR